jgi:hypothetical protein
MLQEGPPKEAGFLFSVGLVSWFLVVPFRAAMHDSFFMVE